MTSQIHITVVAYRSNATLPECLRTLATYEPESVSLVIDNTSPGPFAADGPSVVRASGNRGFGSACNRGADLAPSGAEFLAFLNPDVRLSGPSLSEIAHAMAQQPEIGVATGHIVDAQGSRVPSAWGRPSVLRGLWTGTGWHLGGLRALIGRFLRTGPALSGASMARVGLEVDGHVLGGAMVVRRECFEQLGGFDEDFFLFWEDADLCARARAAGWRIAVLPCTPIVHIEGTSSAGVTADQRWGWYVDGARTYGRKHLSRGRARRLLWALRLGRMLRRRW